MPLEQDIKSEIAQILKDQWTTRDGQVVPEPADLSLGNDGVWLDATVLYADLDGSTSMVDTCKSEFAGEVYKCFLRAAARVIRSEGGTITAYDGDRVMAIFIGNSKNTAAARTALKLNHAVEKIINPAIQAQYPSTIFSLKHVVGIDTSKLLAARTGVRGANDLVWVGPAANYAAKMSAISSSTGRSIISKTVYDSMHESVKFSPAHQQIWTSHPWNNRTVYVSNWTWPV